jgi:N-acetylneuraminate lyase
MEMMFPRLQGLVAAVYSPCHRDGSLHLAVIERQAAVLSADGAAGAFVCGTNGEGFSLSTNERMQVAECWRNAISPGSIRLVVHVGHNSLSDAIHLAKHAQSIGADAISLTAPSYFRATSVDDLLDFCVPVARAAPALPFYYYEIPALTGVHLSMVEFLDKGGRAMPNFAGLKFSSTDLAVLQECCAFAGGRYDLLYGCDEMLLAALAFGVKGAVGSTYNYATPLYLKLIEAFEQGDWKRARELQLKSVQLVRMLQPYGVIAAGKTIMSCRGVDCGPVRPPLRPLSELQRAELIRKIDESRLLQDFNGNPVSSTGKVAFDPHSSRANVRPKVRPA